jgi:hypothetical protein
VSLAADVVVFGDEVESVLTAVSAAQAGAVTVLVRSSQGRLGGLSTRGGLSYMDITPECQAPLFNRFLTEAGVIRVALDPDRAHATLSRLLSEAGVTVVHSDPLPAWPTPGVAVDSLPLADGTQLAARLWIDATPDADLARSAGIPYLKGLGGVLGEDQNYLGISPVFRIAGVPKQDLIAFEARLRARPDMATWLEIALPYHPTDLRAEYLTRPCFSPDDQDYLDILNPVIGIAYHQWKAGAVDGYPTALTWIDGANISLLPDGSMGFNGLVSKQVLMTADPLNELLAYSHGAAIPQYLLEELTSFERFLREAGNLKEAQVIPPEALYVRQTITLLAQANMTARQALAGGVPADQAVGTFSYWLDLRGTQLWKRYPGEHLAKPIFNIGLGVAFPPPDGPSNLAFVSRSAGYSPIGQGAGRIVQHNSMLGEAVGIAAALAVQQNAPMQSIAPAAIRAVLAQRFGKDVPLWGQAVVSADYLETSALLAADADAIETLRTDAKRQNPLTAR